MTTNKNKWTGADAFNYALVTGLPLRKYADPQQGACEYDLSSLSELVDAQLVLREDPSLLWCELRFAGAAVHAVFERLGLVVHLVADDWAHDGLVSDNWLPVSDARRAEEALRAEGIVASCEPDWDDGGMAWIYVSVRGDQS